MITGCKESFPSETPATDIPPPPVKPQTVLILVIYSQIATHAQQKPATRRQSNWPTIRYCENWVYWLMFLSVQIPDRNTGINVQTHVR